MATQFAKQLLQYLENLDDNVYIETSDVRVELNAWNSGSFTDPVIDFYALIGDAPFVGDFQTRSTVININGLTTASQLIGHLARDLDIQMLAKERITLTTAIKNLCLYARAEKDNPLDLSA